MNMRYALLEVKNTFRYGMMQQSSLVPDPSDVRGLGAEAVVHRPSDDLYALTLGTLKVELYPV